MKYKTWFGIVIILALLITMQGALAAENRTVYYNTTNEFCYGAISASLVFDLGYNLNSSNATYVEIDYTMETSDASCGGGTSCPLHEWGGLSNTGHQNHEIAIGRDSSTAKYMTNSATTWNTFPLANQTEPHSSTFNWSIKYDLDNKNFTALIQNTANGWVNAGNGSTNNKTINNQSIRYGFVWNGGAANCMKNIAIVGIVATPDATNFSITLSDQYDSSAINNFSAEIGGTNYTTTTGTITTNILSNDTSLYNIFLFNAKNNQGFYFNKTYTNHNVSSNLAGTLPQTDIKVLAYSKITNTSLSGDINISGTDKGNTNESIYFTAAGYTLTYSNGSWYPKNQAYTFTALENKTVVITGVYNQIINISGANITGGEVIANPYGRINSTTFNENYNASAVNYYEFQGETSQLYTIGFNATNYASNLPNAIQAINSASRYYKANFTLYRDKSIYFYVRDIVTGHLLNYSNITLNGAVNYNFNLFNMSTFQYNLNTGTYTVTAIAAGYGSASGTTEIKTGSLDNQTFYLSADPTTVAIYVRNPYNQYIEGANVTLIRQSDGTNLGLKTTDLSGAVSFEVQKSIGYIINITATNYDTYSKTLNIIESTYTITIEFANSSSTSYYKGFNYNFTPFGNNSIANSTSYDFTFQFVSSYWNVTGCELEIYDENLTYITNTSCYSTTSTGSGTINLNTGNNNSLQLRSIIQINGATITYLQYYFPAYRYIGSYSLYTALKNLGQYNKVGFGQFAKITIAVLLLIALIVTVLGTTNSAIIGDEYVTIILLIIGGLGILSVTGFLNIGGLQTPTNFGADLTDWTIFLLIGGAGLVLIYKKWGDFQ